MTSMCMTHLSAKLLADKARYHALDEDVLLLPDLVSLITSTDTSKATLESHIS